MFFFSFFLFFAKVYILLYSYSITLDYIFTKPFIIDDPTNRISPSLKEEVFFLKSLSALQCFIRSLFFFALICEIICSNELTIKFFFFLSFHMKKN